MEEQHLHFAWTPVCDGWLVGWSSTNICMDSLEQHRHLLNSILVVMVKAALTFAELCGAAQTSAELHWLVGAKQHSHLLNLVVMMLTWLGKVLWGGCRKSLVDWESVCN